MKRRNRHFKLSKTENIKKERRVQRYVFVLSFCLSLFSFLSMYGAHVVPDEVGCHVDVIRSWAQVCGGEKGEKLLSIFM